MRIRVCQTIDNFVVRSRARGRKTNQPLKKENKRKIGAQIENEKITSALDERTDLYSMVMSRTAVRVD